MTVRRPFSFSGSEADLMPEKTVRVSVPKSSVSFKSLSEPSTCSALTILATRKSTFLKSSIESGPFAFATGAAELRVNDAEYRRLNPQAHPGLQDAAEPELFAERAERGDSHDACGAEIASDWP